MKKVEILGAEDTCFLCGRTDGFDPLNRHEIFYGSGRRQLSIEDGLCVMLCHNRCHQFGPDAVHNNHEKDLWLKQVGQRYAMIKYDWTEEQFRQRYGKNYLDESGLDIWPEEAI